MDIDKKPIVYMLVGVPGSGKSTWVSNQDWRGLAVYLSTDAKIEQLSKAAGMTYDQGFSKFIGQAEAAMNSDLKKAVSAGKNIIWDQTNLTAKSRARKLAQLDNYTKVAVVFKPPALEELARRLASRPGKTIPDNIILQMLKQFQIPTKAEGFDEVWFAAN